VICLYQWKRQHGKKRNKGSTTGINIMKQYDYLIIGGGTAGLAIAFNAAETGMKTALIEKGPIGGTCHNVGCVPSKILIHQADLIVAIQRAEKFGIKAEISGVDFGAIMGKMRRHLEDGRKSLEDVLANTKNLDWFREECYFADEYGVRVGQETIKGSKIFIASGSRNQIPPIKGIEGIDYLTNESLLKLTKKPDSMIIIGGGYVASEYAHFFASVGTRVRILQDGERLLANEEPEISDALKAEMSKRMEIITGVRAVEVKTAGRGYVVRAKNTKTEEEKEFEAESILVATGRKSNADLIRVENAGIETDKRNYIKVDEFLQTNKRDIWAVGDAIDKQMFTHSADLEAGIAWHNATEQEKKKMNFDIVPHAVYSYPRIASVGMTEAAAAGKHKILVGVARYSDTLKGEIMLEDTGFAKAIVEKETGKILGFHIIGPHAPLLIQEVTNVIAKNGTIDDIKAGLHIFPTLSELIPEALGKLKEVKG